MHHVQIAPIAILSLIIAALIILTVTGVVLLSLILRKPNHGLNFEANTTTRNRRQHVRHNSASVSWMISPSVSSDSETLIRVSPSCPMVFGDAETKERVHVMVTPPTPAKRERAP
ncbi:hypothetical protein LshimejAT787_0208400 [Lyophyllum shimeji]|uniref:Uncharacterized protein n=1 Tax=Lyophyllum shimeji TaxID=47721 RepID=A0A9P3UL65_LYOSH|nr:hypothetical protein LshimejAT787_0208400 [Lyophyllum shimeji]